MTIEKTIEYYEEKAKELENNAKSYPRPNKTIKGSGKKYNAYIKRATEYRQLASWLTTLKEIWDSGDCNNCRNSKCEWKSKLGQLVRYNCPHYVGVANWEVNVDDGVSN